MKDVSETAKPVLVMIRGLPGSGKSYLATELQKIIGNDSVVLLDPDATDYSSEEYIIFSSELSEQDVELKLHSYRYLRFNAYKAIVSGRIIIWNQAFTNQDLLHRTILNLQTYAAQQGIELPVLIVEVEIDTDTAKERVASRAMQGGHDVDGETFERFIKDYTRFSDYGYRIITVNGSDNVSGSATIIRDAIAASRKI